MCLRHRGFGCGTRDPDASASQSLCHPQFLLCLACFSPSPGVPICCIRVSQKLFWERAELLGVSHHHREVLLHLSKKKEEGSFHTNPAPQLPFGPCSFSPRLIPTWLLRRKTRCAYSQPHVLGLARTRLLFSGLQEGHSRGVGADPT